MINDLHDKQGESTMDTGPEEPEIPEAPTPLVPLPPAHPEESLPRMDHDAEVTESQDEGFNDLKIIIPTRDRAVHNIAVYDPNVPEKVPTFAMMRALRENARNNQSDTWNPIAEGRPPPWYADGWIPAVTQHVVERNAAQTAAASIDPSTLSSLISGRNLEVTRDLERKDLQLGFPKAPVDKEVYRQTSALEPFFYDQLMAKQAPSQRFGPVKLVDAWYGSARVLD